MASSQTSNYKLNQWAASDKFLRTEFNSDNSKIDAALKAINTRAVAARVKLAERTLSSAAGSVTIDLSSVQMSSYAQLELVITTGAVTYGGIIYTRINGVTDTSQYSDNMPGLKTGYTGFLQFGGAAIHARLLPTLTGVGCLAKYVYAEETRSASAEQASFSKACAWSGVKTLILFVDNQDSQWRMAAGTHVIVWGIPK